MQQVAEGRPIKAIAVAQGTTPAEAGDAVEKLFLRIAQRRAAAARTRCGDFGCSTRPSSTARSRARR